jgi:phosphate transport system substrate-binding protein
VDMTRFGRTAAISASLAIGLSAVLAPASWALKYAAPEHHMKADPTLPVWVPAKLELVPEQEFNIVGADIMDEMTMGWVKAFRRAYPTLSVTMEARASGSGIPALTAGVAHVAPVGREGLPAEVAAFKAKYGYEPLAFRVATGSVGSLGKTAASIVMVDKDNPIACLSLDQLDAIYSTTRKRGHADIETWGDLGLKGAWASRPIHLYGLKSPNGIEQYFKAQVMEGGDYKTNIEMVSGKGFTHAFTVAAEDMASHPGGLTYAMLANIRPNTRAVPLSQHTGGPCVSPTVASVYDHSYPLSRYVYIYVNKVPGKPLSPEIREFLKLVLSREGQDAVASDGVYLPLQPAVVREELAKLAAN